MSTRPTGPPRRRGRGCNNRDDRRVRAGLSARVRRGSRVRDAQVMNLSATGAFLAMPRPFVPRSHFTLEIQLPDAFVETDAEVMFANVPGNLVRPNLPEGMGVRFVGLGPAAGERLRDYVDALAEPD